MHSRLLLLAVSSILMIVAMAQLLQGDFSPESGYQTLVAVLSLLWAVALGFSIYRALGTLYSFGVAYAAMLTLFHLGIVVPQTLGIIGYPNWSFSYLHIWLAVASWYTILALGALGIGYALALRAPPRPSPSETAIALQVTYSYGLGLLLASAIFFVYALATLGDLTAYARLELFQTSADLRGFGAFLMVFPSALTCLVVGAHKPKQRVFAFTVATLGFLVLLVSGYRTSAFYPVVLGAVVWVKTGRRIPQIVAAASVTFILIAIPIVGALRTAGTYKDIIYQQAEGPEAIGGWRSSFVTMGQTLGILAEILRLVPAVDPFRYGESYLDATLRALPNITLSHSPSPRAVMSQDMLLSEDMARSMPPADWLTYRLSPQKFYNGEGTGFSAIGEAYLNFGMAGVILIMGAIGWGLGRLDATSLVRNPTILFLCAAAMFHFVRTVRDDFGNFTKPFVFIVVISIIWWVCRRLLLRPSNPGRSGPIGKSGGRTYPNSAAPRPKPGEN